MEESDFDESILTNDIDSSEPIELSDAAEGNFYYILTKKDEYLFGKVKELIEDGSYYTLVFNIYKQFDLDDATWKEARPKGRRVVFGPDLEDKMPNLYEEIIREEDEEDEEAEEDEEDEAPKPPISNTTKYISKGSFGLTLRPALPNKKNNGSWEQYNNNITKLFFNKSDRAVAFAASAQVREYTGNEGHKANPYKHIYKRTNLPNSLITDISNAGVLKKMGETLYPLRMPNLGVDFSTLYKPDRYRPLRRIPLLVMLEQIKKVLTQVNIFAQKGKVHSDIRNPNMMINTKTGAITIIDFDFFSNAPIFFKGENVAFYNRPPENYIFCNYFQRRDDFPEATILLKEARENAARFKETITALESVLITQEKETKKRMYDLGTYMKDNNNYSIFRKELGLNLISKDDLIETIRNNYVTIMKDQVEINDAARNVFENELLKYFDGFGLASSLLDLLVATYSQFAFNPKYTMKAAIGNLRERLEKKVEKAAGGAGAAAGNITYEKYTDSELIQIYKTVQCVFYAVLLPIVSLNISDRSTPALSLSRLDKIIALYDKPENLNKIHSAIIPFLKEGLESTVGKKLDIEVKITANNASVAAVPALPPSSNSKASKGGKSKTKSARKHKQKKNKTYKKKSRK